MYNRYTIVFVFLLIVPAFSQPIEFSEYVDTTSINPIVAEVDEAITQGTTFTEIVIIAKDFEANPILPSWFDEVINGLPVFFNEGTFGNFDYNAEVLKADEILNHAFIFPEAFDPPFMGGCEHVHKFTNMVDVIEQADVIYDFSLLDFNGDNIVPVHFTSIGPGGGVSGDVCPVITSTDLGVGGQYVKVKVVQQTRGSIEKVFRNVFYHESGHTFFSFPDMNHGGSNAFNHYGIGAFDVMSGGGFNNRSSLYNPVLRFSKGWTSPNQIISNTTVNFTDFDLTGQTHYYELPSYSHPTPPSFAIYPDQKLHLTYYTRPSSIRWQATWLIPESLAEDARGLLIWHSNLTNGSWVDRIRLPIDIEAAHGKWDWIIDDPSGLPPPNDIRAIRSNIQNPPRAEVGDKEDDVLKVNKK